VRESRHIEPSSPHCPLENNACRLIDILASADVTVARAIGATGNLIATLVGLLSLVELRGAPALQNICMSLVTLANADVVLARSIGETRGCIGALLALLMRHARGFFGVETNVCGLLWVLARTDVAFARTIATSPGAIATIHSLTSPRHRSSGFLGLKEDLVGAAGGGALFVWCARVSVCACGVCSRGGTDGIDVGIDQGAEWK
jgi:hypothetical protein